MNFIADEFDTYWSAGVQLQWTPWAWGTADRERAALALQQQIVDADEAAFRDGLDRAVQDDLAALDRLEATSGARRSDRRASRGRSIAKRACGTTSARCPPPSISTRARICWTRGWRTVTHRVELARASARLLTTLGVEVR